MHGIPTSPSNAPFTIIRLRIDAVYNAQGGTSTVPTSPAARQRHCASASAATDTFNERHPATCEIS